MKTQLPIYHNAIDFEQFYRRYPVPDVFVDTVYKWSPERIRDLQNERFLEVMEIGWTNPFYQRLWRKSGIEPGDIKSLADITKLPIYTSEDIKVDQQEHPPFGILTGFPSLADHMKHTPVKLVSSGGTTGKPRMTLHGISEWEWGALGAARNLYVQGVRPGDVVQIPATCSLANLGWALARAAHEYLGALPLTTGSGVVTPSRRQIEIAFDVGTNCWCSFPEYMLRLAEASREEFGRDVRELKTKMIHSYLGPDLEGTLRAQLEELWGCPVYDNYGTNELGAGAFECQHRNGLHLMEDAVYLEVLDTETNQPVPPGKVGNLIATVFTRQLMPSIRYNLRDLGRIVATERCECGSHFRRMDHFLGRSDNMVKLRGVNVYPMACLPAVRSDERTTGEWLCEAYTVGTGTTSRDELIVHIEVRKDAGSIDGLQEKLAARLKSDLGLGVEVKLVEQSQLDTAATLGEGKAKRLLDKRPAYAKKV
ncbi:MAG: AMP-binding protein [Acidobacteriaceae bacterium]|nr:AMP-binding protein [Acidobacteriaceae bacterium]